MSRLAVVEARLAPLLGVRFAEAQLLADRLARDRRRRAEARANQSGISAQAIDTLLGLYLSFAGLGCAGLALSLRAQPGQAALLLLALTSAVAVGMSAHELFGVLLADEGFRVIAAWPVRSQSFLYARLREPTRRLLRALLLLTVPPALALAIGSGVPLLTGALFLLLALANALALSWLMAALYSALLGRLGAARARAIGTLLQLAGLVTPLLLGALAHRLPPAALDPAHTSRALPLTWLATLVELGAVHVRAADLWMLPAALAWLIALPLGAFVLTARDYTRGLATARLQRTRPPRTPPVDWALWLLRRPADRVVVRLFEAHARFDWRFRAQLLALPLLVVVLVASGAAGLDVRRLFADPLRPLGLWHPAMIFVVLALLQPVLALPLISCSAEHGATWILRTGVIPMSDFVASGRRIVRVLLVLPLLTLIALGYLWARIPLWSLLVHVAMLALLAEAVARAVQQAFPYPPFTRPTDDEELASAFVAAGLLLYVFCGLVALFVVHVVYRAIALVL